MPASFAARKTSYPSGFGYWIGGLAELIPRLLDARLADPPSCLCSLPTVGSALDYWHDCELSMLYELGQAGKIRQLRNRLVRPTLLGIGGTNANCRLAGRA